MPLVWKSQLISKICLSTLHAKYIGLVKALRNLIPIRTLVAKTLDFLNLPNGQNPSGVPEVKINPSGVPKI